MKRREWPCGCVHVYEGMLGACTDTLPCDGHTPSWRRPGFKPASTQPAPAEDWERRLLASIGKAPR